MSKVKSIAVVAARTLLGLIYFVFGLNFFLHFLPMPPAQPGPAADFSTGLFQAGYFFPMLKGIEVVLGSFLLFRFFTPLSLIILAPVSLNIFLFHAFLEPEGLLMGIVILFLNIYLLWVHRDHFKSFLKPRTGLAA
jgi:putative oxidoreductase